MSGERRNVETTKHRMDSRRGDRLAGPRRRGFPLVEVMLAAVIATFVLGSLAVTMGQLGRVKETSKLRLDAHLRAESALNAVRRDIASVIRNDDLFWTRLLIRQGNVQSPIGELMRDEILVFNTRLVAMQDLNFSGEGMQYETQYRIEETHHGAMLWQRRDAVPDEFPLAGGVATPLVDNIVAMKIEAYDGYEWVSQWDSDERGLPLAVRVTVAASGSRTPEYLYEGPIVQLRAVVPIDRVIPPADLLRPTEEELEQMLEEAEDVTDTQAAAAGGGRGGRGGAGGAGRGGGGRDGMGGRPGDGAEPRFPRGRGAPGEPGMRPGRGGSGGQGGSRPGWQRSGGGGGGGGGGGRNFAPSGSSRGSLQ